MKVDNPFMVFNTKDDPVLKHSQKMQKIFNQKTTTYEVIEAEEKEKVSIGMMSYLVKHPKNPDGIDIDKLNKMSDSEIIVAYNKWKEANSDNKS